MDNCHALLNLCVNIFAIWIRFLSGDSEESKAYVDQCAGLKCPSECVCEGTTVDCSKRGLREVPQDIPEHVTHL